MTERTVIDIEHDGPENYEIVEVSDAKDEVHAIVWDMYDWFDIDDTHKYWTDSRNEMACADKIVEKLIALGWRPTREV